MNQPRGIPKSYRSGHDPTLEKERLNKNQRKYVEKNRDKQRAAHIYRTYGISWEEYLVLFARQNGECSICKVSLSTHIQPDNRHEIAHIDHCHETGKIRGLLCNKCNSAIGYFNESALLCKLGAEYLEENK